MSRVLEVSGTHEEFFELGRLEQKDLELIRGYFAPLWSQVTRFLPKSARRPWPLLLFFPKQIHEGLRAYSEGAGVKVQDYLELLCLIDLVDLMPKEFAPERPRWNQQNPEVLQLKGLWPKTESPPRIWRIRRAGSIAHLLSLPGLLWHPFAFFDHRGNVSIYDPKKSGAKLKRQHSPSNYLMTLLDSRELSQADDMSFNLKKIDAITRAPTVQDFSDLAQIQRRSDALHFIFPQFGQRTKLVWQGNRLSAHEEKTKLRPWQQDLNRAAQAAAGKNFNLSGHYLQLAELNAPKNLQDQIDALLDAHKKNYRKLSYRAQDDFGVFFEKIKGEKVKDR